MALEFEYDTQIDLVAYWRMTVVFAAVPTI